MDEKQVRIERKVDAFAASALTATIRLVVEEEARLTGIPVDAESEQGIVAVLLGDILNRWENGRTHEEARAELHKLVDDVYGPPALPS
ncbi:MAG: hypothetical protein EPN91_13055 [Salinibacterium sp.]|nr:MAG: hypothetical protein EPN91_13055 [Salinibacterium sp.]